MKTKKLLTLLLASVMTLSLAACGEKAAEQDETSVSESVDAPVSSTVVENASIDFEDGNFAFVGYEGTIVGGTGESELSIVDYNGSKALKAVSTGKNICVAFQADALLGDQLANVAKVEFTLGTENPSGEFKAVSGKAYVVGAEATAENAWSVYVEKGNPKRFSYDVTDLASYFAISLETDNANDAGLGRTDLYIDDICFLDAEGNVLTVDTAAEFVVASGPDRSNLYNLGGAVEFAGCACSGDAWAQNGFDMPQEIIDALVPGAVVEIEYASEDGEIWIVMPDAAAGWMRVAQNDCLLNDSRSVAQITYEQIAALCGEDKSTWGARMQFEGSSAWSVFSVKVGTVTTPVEFVKAVDFEGFACSADAWAQNGFDMPQEVIDALVPGAVVRIEYKSEDGAMWIVMPDAAAGWMRVGATGSGDDAICDGSVCYVTYEQIAALCGEDKSTWGARMQCEGSTAWEVYAVSVGSLKEVEDKVFKPGVDFAGFACSADAWAQNGFEMPQEVIDALVPGAVVRIEYKSEDGAMWIVMPDAAAGWMRVGQAGTGDDAVCDGTYAYITYEQIAALCGEDKSTWGARMQCEGSTAWEVYSVNVGTYGPGALKLRGQKEFAGAACGADAWAQNGTEMPQEIIDALVPGTAVKINYASEDGAMWIVMPDAAAGWSRVGQTDAICTGNTCYVTYEQIAAICGDDKATWGARMQFEGSSAWEVYGVYVGTVAE